MRNARFSIGSIATLAILIAAIVAAGTPAAAQSETVLHSFNDNGKDGTQARASLVSDSAGNLYGTTYTGGAYNYGTVFELSPKRRNLDGNDAA